MPIIIFLILICAQIVFGSDDDTDSPYDTYPDPHLTPGVIFSDITVKDLCKRGYARKKRDVSSQVKRSIKEAYGIDAHDPNYTIDHFIPLCLGGTNDPQNLWPQRINGIKYGSDQKAESDYYLYRQVCEGTLSLDQARNIILEDWVRAYRQCCTVAQKQYKKERRRKLRRAKNASSQFQPRVAASFIG